MVKHANALKTQFCHRASRPSYRMLAGLPRKQSSVSGATSELSESPMTPDENKLLRPPLAAVRQLAPWQNSVAGSNVTPTPSSSKSIHVHPPSSFKRLHGSNGIMNLQFFEWTLEEFRWRYELGMRNLSNKVLHQFWP